ncbi:MAG: galactose-1-phosphate uridylyltransferase [Bacillota bacterium]
MPVLRQDPLTGEWVIIATERARRPETFARKKNEEDHYKLNSREAKCPFCPGNEHLTPPEVLVYHPEHAGLAYAGSPGTAAGTSPHTSSRAGYAAAMEESGGNGAAWAVRVIPNKFPALERNESIKWDADLFDRCGYFQSYQGYGVHEVIIETPVHNRHLGDLEEGELSLVLRSFADRTIALGEDPHLRYVQIFRNHRREAGASIEHPHCQLLGLPYIPPLLEKEYTRAHAYYLERGRCLLCTLLEEEEKDGSRIVLENDSYVAYIPFAASLPFSTLIVPREHSSSLETNRQGWEEKLAPLLREFLVNLSERLEDPPYNMYLHTAPLRSQSLPYYHWHLALIPKLTIVAGWEMATGTYINVSQPEEAAQFLRS